MSLDRWKQIDVQGGLFVQLCPALQLYMTIITYGMRELPELVWSEKVHLFCLVHAHFDVFSQCGIRQDILFVVLLVCLIQVCSSFIQYMCAENFHYK